jgi:hypothetical protein
VFSAIFAVHETQNREMSTDQNEYAEITLTSELSRRTSLVHRS